MGCEDMPIRFQHPVKAFRLVGVNSRCGIGLFRLRAGLSDNIQTNQLRLLEPIIGFSEGG